MGQYDNISDEELISRLRGGEKGIADYCKALSLYAKHMIKFVIEIFSYRNAESLLKRGKHYELFFLQSCPLQ